MVDQNKLSGYRDAIEAFYFAYREFTSRPDRILAVRGLNRAHHRILYFVGKNPDIGVNHLLSILKISKQALNAPLRQLLEMNLIHSLTASHDGRAKCMRLTHDGEKLEKQLTNSQMRLLEKAFEQSPKNTKEEWIKIMHRIASDDR